MLTFPREWIAINRGFSKSHKGVDLMWSSANGGSNAPVYAMGDGKVIATVDGLGNMAGSNSYGNCINISHGDNVYTFYAHLLKGSLLVKVGDTIKRGQIIAKMNNSGNSRGSHLHFEVRKGGSSNADVVDPLLYTYLDTSWQTATDGTKKDYKILEYTPPERVGTPVMRDFNRNQIQLTSTVRYGRAAPTRSGEALGYMNTGIYNILGQSNSDSYTWFKVEKGLYFAYIPESDTILYAEDEKDKIIEEQKQQIAVLTAKIDTALPLLQSAVDALTK